MMAWFCAMIMYVSPTKLPSVDLNFRSADYLIESSEIVILRSDSFAPPGDRVILPSGDLVPLPDIDQRAKPALLSNGSVEKVEISEPGTFTALLTTLVVLRLSDQRRFEIPQFAVAEFRLTNADLQRGVGEIPIDPGGIFRVLVLDSDGTPLPRKVISFSKVRARESIRLIQIESDEHGEILVFGCPDDYRISPHPADADSVKLQIDRL